MCMQATAFWLNKRNCPLEVLYVFERGHKWQAEADTLLKSIALDDKMRARFRYRNHLFEDKRKECALQAADLFAWTVTKAKSCMGNKVPPAMRPFISPIMKLARLNSRQNINMLTGEKLKRFIDEQSYGTEGIFVDFGPRRRAFR